MSFPDIPAGYGVPLVDLATDLPPSDMLDALDKRYGKGNTTTDSLSIWDGADDITVWRPPGAAGSITPVAGASFTLSSNLLYLRNGFLLGQITFARTSGTLTHGDTVMTLPVGARPDHDYSVGALFTLAANPSLIDLVRVMTTGVVQIVTPPAGRTGGNVSFVLPIPYDYT
jgi:hypothetical protein